MFLCLRFAMNEVISIIGNLKPKYFSTSVYDCILVYGIIVTSLVRDVLHYEPALDPRMGNQDFDNHGTVVVNVCQIPFVI